MSWFQKITLVKLPLLHTAHSRTVELHLGRHRLDIGRRDGVNIICKFWLLLGLRTQALPVSASL